MKHVLYFTLRNNFTNDKNCRNLPRFQKRKIELQNLYNNACTTLLNKVRWTRKNIIAYLRKNFDMTIHNKNFVEPYSNCRNRYRYNNNVLF